MSQTYTDPRKYRFIVSTDIPPSFKRKGYRAEVIDGTHPSDGGPVAIEWFETIEDAQLHAAKLNNPDDFYACVACGGDPFRAEKCMPCAGTGLMSEGEAKDAYFAA